MGETQDVPSTDPVPDNPDRPTNIKPGPFSKQLLAEVGVRANGELVKERVLEALTEVEIERRVTAVKSLLQLIDVVSNEIKKVKPKQPGFQFVDGKRVPAGDPVFDEQQISSLEKLTKRSSRLQAVLQKAIEQNTGWDEVFKLAQGKEEPEEKEKE